MGKKNIARFCIKFDPNDPTHARAIEILNSCGRKKAERIAQALCRSQDAANAAYIFDKVQSHVDQVDELKASNTGNTSKISDDVLNSINDSLDAFGFIE